QIAFGRNPIPPKADSELVGFTGRILSQTLRCSRGEAAGASKDAARTPGPSPFEARPACAGRAPQGDGQQLKPSVSLRLLRADPPPPGACIVDKYGRAFLASRRAARAGSAP